MSQFTEEFEAKDGALFLTVRVGDAMMDEWLGQHRAFMKRETAFRPAEVRRRALVAIDAGGAGGVSMADVHASMRSARLPAWLVNLVVDRLVADGHVHRVRVETAGRPRIQMWSYQNAPEEVRPDMAYAGVWSSNDFSRPRCDGMIQENIIIDVLRRIGDNEARIRDLDMAAGQVYVDANAHMSLELFRRRGGGVLTKGQMHKLLMSMVRQRWIRQNAEGDAFRL